jgi:sulfur carrier protein
MKKIKIFINGDEKNINENSSIKDLINLFDLDIKKIAIEKDFVIINETDFEKTLLNENCKIEIVHFIGGG